MSLIDTGVPLLTFGLTAVMGSTPIDTVSYAAWTRATSGTKG